MDQIHVTGPRTVRVVIGGDVATSIGRGGGRIAIGPTGTATFAEKPVVAPGLDPTDRTARASLGWRSLFGPGLTADDTAEWREQLGTFDSNRDATTRNTARFWGWNYQNGAAQIDQAFGSIGGSEENSYQPPVPGETWSEEHWRFTPPGGNERRPVTFYGSWTTGATGLTLAGTGLSLQFKPADGSTATEVLNWNANTALNVQGLGFWYATNNAVYNRQLNAAADAYVALPYADALNRVVVGYDYAAGVVADQIGRGLVMQHRTEGSVATPAAGYTTLFYDSADGVLKQKNSAGVVTPV